MSKRAIQVIIAAVALGAVAVLAYRESDTLAASFAKLRPIDWIIVLSLSLLNFGIRMLRWHQYVVWLSPAARVPLGLHAAYYVAGFAFTVTPGKAGELYRGIYLKRHGVTLDRTLSVLVVERLLDAACIAMLSIGVLGVLPQYGVLLIITLGVCLGVFVFVLALDRFPVKLGMWVRRHKWIAWMHGQLSNIRVHVTSLLAPRQLAYGLGLGLAAWAAAGAGFYWILSSMDQPITMAQAMTVFSISILAGAASFAAGGLGGTELVMIASLRILGLDLGSAIAATLICQITMLWFAVVIGVVSIACLSLLQPIPSKPPAA